ncbi:DUF2972 domain-containing protein [Helicobacter sp. MIT 21-1697]|uniref:DUF2972 domain-containing protein n=1 Tax=Helicobacter sp. MIT 21-1697 TaxID=2993733 RepID=UPI00224A528F|nr:DUF2972 domain-containing protein [Helicobacter sp. MIT 21-1697]MCX2716271.1 DUF2972 domain-containing protein [Helicobacter sp. MIT 21-1697]
MLFLIFISHNPHKFGVYKILKRFHIVTTHNPTLVFISQYYEEINSWIESIEFKEQYLETNHPYPPMLNPKRLSARNSKNKEQESLESKSIVEIQPYPNLSYNNLSAQIAWDLNLPLPPYYQFVYWGSHGTGNTGLHTFLNYCGMSSCCYERGGANIYKGYFKQIINHYNEQRKYIYLAIRIYIEDEKFYALISNVPSLNLVRDPISMLKHYMGVKRATNKQCRTITLLTNPDEICQNLVQYGNGAKYPPLELSEYWINFKYMCFHDTQLKNALINLQDSIIIDMSEIVGERAFETIKRLSQSLGFPAPKEEERERFKENISQYNALLPLSLFIKSKKKNIYIYLMDKVYKDDKVYQNLTPFLFNQDCFYDRIIVCANKKDFEILKQDTKILEEVKDYLLRFIQRLQEQKNIEDTKKITESQVLEYLREHKDLRIRFKHILDEHLAYIKKERPDIVESWKYYQEFERMCEE